MIENMKYEIFFSSRVQTNTTIMCNILTLQDCGRTQLRKSCSHKVSQHLNVIMIPKTVLYVI